MIKKTFILLCFSYAIQLQLHMSTKLVQVNSIQSEQEQNSVQQKNDQQVQNDQQVKQIQNDQQVQQVQKEEVKDQVQDDQKQKLSQEQVQKNLQLVEQLSQKLQQQTERMEKDHQLIQQLINEKQKSQDDNHLEKNQEIEKNQKNDQIELETIKNQIEDQQTKLQKPTQPQKTLSLAENQKPQQNDQKLVNGKLQFENAYNKKPILVVNLEKAKQEIINNKLNKEKQEKEAQLKALQKEQELNAAKIIEKDPLDFFSKSPTLVPSLKYYGDRVSQPLEAGVTKSKQDEVYYNNIKPGAGGDNRRKRFQQLELKQLHK